MDYGKEDSGSWVFRPGDWQVGRADGENPIGLCHVAGRIALIGLQAGFFRYGSLEKRPMENFGVVVQTAAMPDCSLSAGTEQFGKVFSDSVPFILLARFRYSVFGDRRLAGCLFEGASGTGSGAVPDQGCFP